MKPSGSAGVKRPRRVPALTTQKLVVRYPTWTIVRLEGVGRV